MDCFRSDLIYQSLLAWGGGVALNFYTLLTLNSSICSFKLKIYVRLRVLSCFCAALANGDEAVEKEEKPKH